MLNAEATQFLVDMVLWAVFAGCATGFIFTGVLNNLLELVLRYIDRRERIAAARARDHSKVPQMTWGGE